MSHPNLIYLAGPMTGLPDHNFPAFRAAAERLQQAGWEVVNPADNFGGRTDLPRGSYLRADVVLLLQCDAMAMLPGWADSRGAKLEYLLGRELGMPIIDVATFQPLADAPAPTVHLHELRLVEPPESPSTAPVLEEAAELTSGQRNADYGHPREDFGRTAQMWTGVLADKLREGQQIDAMDVPLCMIAVKLARQAHRHKRDNLVDIAGYARTAAMIAGEE